MVKKYSNSIRIPANIEKVHDITVRFLPTIGYKVVESMKPNSIVATRGSKLGFWTSVEVLDLPTTLKVSLATEGNEALVSFDYEIKVVGIMTGYDTKKLDSELERLKSSVASSS